MTTARSFPVELLAPEADQTPVVEPKFWRGVAFAVPLGLVGWLPILWAFGWL